MFSLQGSIHHHTPDQTGNGGDEIFSVKENKTCGVPSRRLCAIRTRRRAGSGITESGRRFSWRVALRGLQGYGSGWTASGKRYSARLANRNGKTTPDTTTSSTCPFLFSSILFLSPQRQRRRRRQGRQLQSPNVADAVSDEPQDFDADFTTTTDVAGEAGPPCRQLKAGWVSMALSGGKRRKLDTLGGSGNNGSTQSDPFAFRRGYVCVPTACGKRFKASLHV